MNLHWIKKVYLYAVSLVSLIIMVIAGIMLINLGLKQFVFTKADDMYYDSYPAPYCDTVASPLLESGEKPVLARECTDPEYAQQMEEKRKQENKNRQTARRQSDAAQALAMLIIASPVFYYHWKLARKES